MTEPVFVPRVGQKDYTHEKRAPVINCVLRHRGKILLVKRSKGMRLYPGVWNGISGFLDDEKKPEDKAREELHEELGILAEGILSMHSGPIFEEEAPEYDKTWIVHPILIEVRHPDVKLDWEGSEYVWVKPKEISKYDLLPGLKRVLEALGV